MEGNMARYLDREWKKSELLAFIGDPLQVSGAKAFCYTEGKASGVKGIDVNTGGGLGFTVLPGRGMDIPHAHYKGVNLNYFSGTGIVSPAYFEEPGLGWLRSFFVGFLTTCGITNAGAPSVDKGEPFGLHGRVSNAEAENISIEQEWKDNEFLITLKGTVRESKPFFENMSLTRKIETGLGWKRFRITDRVENKGFEPQPLMVLYHINFGFPLLSPTARVVGPIKKTEPRDEEARKDRGVEECLEFPHPQAGYQEKVFFHELGADKDGSTFIALLNRDIGNGMPLGITLSFNRKQLPTLTEWKMMRKGLYVLGLEPGVVHPLGRGSLREQDKLVFLEGQESHTMTIDFEIVDSLKEIDAVEKRALSLK
jgi:hypothetical protein